MIFSFHNSLPSASKLHKQLRKSNQVGPVQDAIRLIVAKERTSILYELWTLLEEEPNGIFDHEVESIKRYIIEHLSISPGISNVNSAIELMDRHGDIKFRQFQLTQLASRIAYAQTSETVMSVLRTCKLEFSACLMQEALFRQKMDSSVAIVNEISCALRDSNHPLSSLPFYLYPIEEAVCLPSYGDRVSSDSIPFGPSGNAATHTIEKTCAVPFQEITQDGWTERAGKSFKRWEEESGGVSEAKLFRADPIPDDPVTIFNGLIVESISPGDIIDFTDWVELSSIYRLLFAATATGGAYTGGLKAAYGRLTAWDSLRALMNMDEFCPMNDVYLVGKECRWITFGSQNDWFCNVAWDVGIICLNHKTGTIAYLAATDTD